MLAAAPYEACGYVKNGKFYPVPNCAADPLNTVKPAGLPDDIDMFVHSHPEGNFYPSNVDMAGQIAMGIPWAIYAWQGSRRDWFIWGEGAPREPLIGRGFRHGVTDCYELFRDFYKLVHGLDLRPYARPWRWDRQGQDMYENFIWGEGFREISAAEVLPGDAILFSIGSRVINHSGVYLGAGNMLHHLATRDNGYDPQRLSTVEPLAHFIPFARKYIRYEKDHLDRTVGQTIWACS